MDITIDVTAAAHGRGGIGRYAHELTAALSAQVWPHHSLTAFYNDPNGAILEPPLDTLPRQVVAQSDKPWRLNVLAHYGLNLAQDRQFPGTQLFHATGNVLPHFRHIRRVFTLHDLAFRVYPQAHTRPNLWYLTRMMPHFLRSADRILADSDATRRDAIRWYGVPEAKIVTVYPGVADRFRPQPAEVGDALRQKYDLPHDFLLYVGTIEPRKNLGVLLKAYHALKAHGLPHRLVVAGQKGWLFETFFQELEALGLADDVILPDFFPDADLPALYSAATAFAYPSLYEGFGLPPAEAMACGTPVIASNVSSLPEVVGDAGLLVAPDDVAGLAAAIERVLTDAALRARMREAGMARVARFTWAKAATEAMAVYDAAMGEVR